MAAVRRERRRCWGRWAVSSSCRRGKYDELGHGSQREVKNQQGRGRTRKIAVVGERRCLRKSWDRVINDGGQKKTAGGDGQRAGEDMEVEAAGWVR